MKIRLLVMAILVLALFKIGHAKFHREEVRVSEKPTLAAAEPFKIDSQKLAMYQQVFSHAKPTVDNSPPPSPFTPQKTTLRGKKAHSHKGKAWRRPQGTVGVAPRPVY